MTADGLKNNQICPILSPLHEGWCVCASHRNNQSVYHWPLTIHDEQPCSGREREVVQERKRKGRERGRVTGNDRSCCSKLAVHSCCCCCCGVSEGPSDLLQIFKPGDRANHMPLRHPPPPSSRCRCGAAKTPLMLQLLPSNRRRRCRRCRMQIVTKP